MHLDEAIKRRDEVILHRGSLADYAYELVSDVYPLDQLPDLIRNHIDYASIARDLELNSEVAEVGHNAWIVNSLEF
jgi:antirestriction protein